jgi:Tol biopolymer transport system component
LPEKLVCFPFAEYFRAFEVSPDGTQVALSLDNWLYLLPNNLALLKTINSHSELTKNAICEFFDPLEKDPDHRIIVKFLRWSQDGSRLAFVTHSADREVGDVSIIRVVSYGDCEAAPQALNYFPAWHLLPGDYQHSPALTSFGWDGDALFSFIAATDRETGLGGLFLYDTGLWKLTGPVNLITDCCYRDPSFSPDGSHLLFAYQAEPPDGGLRFYLAPVEAIGDQLALIPLPLPEIDPLTLSSSALRPSIPMPGP